MASKRHLDHAIKVCNGLSLRPADPRCKSLVCRVRKKEDDTKTGVGAQRGKGMHTAWVADQKKLEAENTDGLDGEDGHQEKEVKGRVTTENHTRHQSSSSTVHSGSASSTTSSFLTKHFPKRFFIVKSHTEDDLHLSVERGLWATQSHNEPVLDQAFRTSDSVFLIFGANKSGEFFGYAKMSGPIVKEERRAAWTTRSGTIDGNDSSGSSGKKSSSSARPAGPTIPEDDEVSTKTPPTIDLTSPDMPLLSPINHPIMRSPQPLSDRPTPNLDENHHSLSEGQKGDYLTARGHLHQHYTAPVSPRPPSSAEARRGDSLDPRLLSSMDRLGVNVTESASGPGAADQLAAGSSDSAPVVDEDGISRKDTALSPQERNARLEILDKEEEEKKEATGAGKSLLEAVEQGWGKPFKVEWVRVQKLPFHRTRHLRNSFNGNREVKISRDGTEIEPSVGASLLELFWKDPALDLGASTASRATQTRMSPHPTSNGHEA